jgi:membrane dipeptidase
LPRAGRELIRRCNQLGILVDTSHMNLAGFWDVVNLSEAPIAASHSAVHALSPASRNLTDQQLEAIAASTGLVGINFEVSVTRTDGRDDQETPLTEIVRHMSYVADRFGVAHVGLGSDFDGARMPTRLKDASRLPALFDEMHSAGFSDPEIELVAWGNWRRVLGETWKH